MVKGLALETERAFFVWGGQRRRRWPRGAGTQMVQALDSTGARADPEAVKSSVFSWTFTLSLGFLVACGGSTDGGGGSTDGGAHDVAQGDGGQADAGQEDGGQTQEAPLTCETSLDVASACGGNPVGEWHLDAVCNNLDDAMEKLVGGYVTRFCPAATPVKAAVDANGAEMHLGDDQRVTQTQKARFEATYSFPASCMGFLGLELGCRAIPQGLLALLPKGAASVTADCAVQGDACLCKLGYPIGMREATSPYEVKGNQLVLGTGQEAMEMLFCRRSSKLLIQYVAPIPGGDELLLKSLWSTK